MDNAFLLCCGLVGIFLGFKCSARYQNMRLRLMLYILLNLVILSQNYSEGSCLKKKKKKGQDVLSAEHKILKRKKKKFWMQQYKLFFHKILIGNNLKLCSKDPLCVAKLKIKCLTNYTVTL